MRKFLIALLIILCVALAASVGFLIFLEGKPQDAAVPTTDGTTNTTEAGSTANTTGSTANTTGSTDAVPETTNPATPTFPTESSDEEVPAYTFTDGDVVTPPTVPTGESTERDPDDLETPGMKF